MRRLLLRRSFCSRSSSVEQGAEFSLRRAFSAADVAAFLALTGDSNPIHVDAVRATAGRGNCCSDLLQAAARAAGLSACPTPGLLAASLFPALIGSHLVRLQV